MLSWPDKDPDEVLDYQVDWTERLVAAETITTSVFSVASGDVVIDSSNQVNGIATVWLSAGTNGTNAVVLNRVTTNAGRTYDQSTKLRIRSK